MCKGGDAMPETRVTLREDETPLARLGKRVGRRNGPGTVVGPDRRWVLRVERLRPRERDVLRLAAAGLDDAAIAGALGLAPKTIGHYWCSIYPLLGLARQDGRRWRAAEL